jgi:hypothetical protein
MSASLTLLLLRSNVLMTRSVPIIGVILVVVVAGCSAPFADTAADVTVENQHHQEYELTAYVVADSIGAGTASFRATNASGVRTTVELVELDTGGNFSDVTLAEGWNATVIEISVPSNQTINATLDGWETGDTIVYTVATPSGRLVRVEYDECSRSTVRSRFVFSEGPDNGYHMTCTD